VADQDGDEPLLKSGDTGEEVLLLQVRLFGLGILRELPDSVFNMTTENAVRELQSMRGQENTGQVTQETWEAILYYEQQNAFQYRYLTPYDALAQINYDLEHPEHGGPYAYLSPNYGAAQYGYGQDQYGQDQYGQDQYGQDQYGQDQYGQDDYGMAAGHYAQFAGQLSDDGRWRWDGYTWQSAEGTGAAAGSEYAAAEQADGFVGRLSDDGQWRWDGADWQPAGGAHHGGTTGQLSPDGQWRWDGSQWQVA
jgi:hypothetical protein